MFETIVVATDGSKHADKALRLAADLAQKYASTLVLCHVVAPGPVPEALRRMLETEHLTKAAPAAGKASPGAAQWAPAPTAKVSERGVLREAYIVGQLILDRAERAAREKGARTVRTAVEEGDPADAILACAKRENADAIVLGSRGLSDLRGLLQGSVSHKVGQLATSTCISVK